MKRPDCTVFVKTDKKQIFKEKKQTAKDTWNRGQQGRCGVMARQSRCNMVPKASLRKRVDDKCKHTAFDLVSELSMWLSTYILYFLNIWLWTFSNMQQILIHPPPIFYQHFTIFALSQIFPSVHPLSIHQSMLFLVHFRVNFWYHHLSPTYVRMHNINSSSILVVFYGTVCWSYFETIGK